jgi:Fe-S-cluster containining protein
VREVVEVGKIPTIYLHHLFDPEMAQIYYFWNDVYYRLQTRFVNGACVALFPGKGCMLGDGRPLICKVWPFWWRSGLKPSKDDFPLEINGDCTMATLWKMSIEDILKEFGLSESVIRKQLLTLNKALDEHSKMLKEAMKRNIPPKMLLDWILRNIL